MDRIVLYCVLAFGILSPVELKTCPRDQYLVRVSVHVDFRVSSVAEDYSHYKEAVSESSFKERFDSLDVSASVSGGGGGFSGSASAAYSDVASSVDSSTESRTVEKTRWTAFKTSHLQILRVVTRTISIDGITSKTITKDYKNSGTVKKDLSASELNELADDYLEREFGHSRTGMIRGSTFTEESCIQKKGCRRDGSCSSGVRCGTRCSAWQIPYYDVWCGDRDKISDTTGTEPNIALSECQRRCLDQLQCKFIVYGVNVWDSNKNRCALFRSCDHRTNYRDNNPSVYRKPSLG